MNKKPNPTMQDCKSSQVKAHGYCAATNTLCMPSLTEISAAPAKQEPALPPAQEAPASQLSPIDILAGVLGRIDAAMENLKALKSDVEAAAIAIEEQFSDAKSKSVKFQQLQELLKSI